MAIEREWLTFWDLLQVYRQLPPEVVPACEDYLDFLAEVGTDWFGFERPESVIGEDLTRTVTEYYPYGPEVLNYFLTVVRYFTKTSFILDGSKYYIIEI